MLGNGRCRGCVALTRCMRGWCKPPAHADITRRFFRALTKNSERVGAQASAGLSATERVALSIKLGPSKRNTFT
eukprot:3933864-Rhodomonas_salina.2